MGQEQIFNWLREKRKQSERHYSSIQIREGLNNEINQSSVTRALRCLVLYGEIEIKFIKITQNGFCNGYKPFYRAKEEASNIEK